METKENLEQEWQEMSQEEKSKWWEELANNLTPAQKLYRNLAKQDQQGKATCIWCKKHFEEGILRENALSAIPNNALAWFTPKFLVHAQTTHGFDPDTITDMLDKI